MNKMQSRVGKGQRALLSTLGCAGALALCGCGQPKVRLESKSHTFAELRTVRRGVQVIAPGEAKRAPFPRERLVDGEQIEIAEGGLAWLRRDGGATLLIAGPASLTLRKDGLKVDRGKLFVDTQAGPITDVQTPRGPLHLSDVRASLEVREGGDVSAYVLRGAVRLDEGTQAGAGEQLLVGAGGKATREAARAWEDWTGGLATTDQEARPQPFGVGTVGARTPGAQGEPRFPLSIQRLEVRVKIVNDFALTEVDEVFFNPSSETVEGIYSFRTPEGATLHRFGVDREGELVWGRVKEKAAAAAQYQSNVYVGSTEDPALLEWKAPGVYQARLYPIAPGGARRVVTRYAEWLGRQGPKGERRMYVYPMAAEGAESVLPRIEELTISLDVEKAGARDVRVGMDGVREGNRIIVRAWDARPRADFAAELFDDGVTSATAYRSPHTVELDLFETDKRQEAVEAGRGEADYVLVPVRPTRANEPEGGLDLAVIVDTSAATDAPSLSVARAATQALLAHLGPGDRAAVWAGDATLHPVADGAGQMAAVDEARRRAISAGLSGYERGGASDLGAVVSEAAAKLDPKRRGAVVYIGDGRPTVGETQLAQLREKLGRVGRPVRLFAIGVGLDANMAVLKGLSRGGFAEHVGDARAAGLVSLRVLEEAERPVWLGAQVDLGTTIERVYPRELGALAADETALVVGRIVGPPPKAIKISGSGGEISVPLVTLPLADDGDLRRRWAEGRLVQLLDEGAGRAAVVEVGTRYAVITPFTSLYVPTTRELEKELGKGFARAKRIREIREREQEEKPPEQVTQSSADNKEGGTGTRAKGEEGSMGNPNTRSTGARYGVQGPADNADPHVARQAGLREAAEFGVIGLLNSGASGDPNAPSAPWGRDDSVGNAPLSARGNMWGADIGDSFGAGGLGLSGIGEGGGGRGEGVGLGSVGTIGHGAGTGSGQGFGSGHGRLGGEHKAKPPQVRMGATTVSGKLPPEVIQRIVRQSFGRFRLCYENGLRNNPNLQGRVAVRFVIGKDGAVASVGNGGSDLPDASVVSCVVRSFSGLSFPQPEGGIVTVVYPINFSPGDGAPSPEDKKAEAKQAAEKKAEEAKALAQLAKTSAAPKVQTNEIAQAFMKVTVLGDVPHSVQRCSSGAGVPLDDRRVLWRERLARGFNNTTALATAYYGALAGCEAPSWRERSILLGMMLDAMPTVKGRVELWRTMFKDTGAADVLYRAILSRVKTPAEVRDLNTALGLKNLDPALLAKALEPAKTPQDRARLLRDLAFKFPDDHELSLKLLEAYEDAGDTGAGRALARVLRKGTGGARVRTAVGEHYLRLAKKGGDARDEVEARRTFGELVEFSPDDPVARRRLGDLLRAHGWYEEASRQYETLKRLSPDDTSLPLLLAAAAQGMGKVEEAIQYTEKGNASNAPDGASGTGRIARAFASAYLAWARVEAKAKGKGEELDQLRTRARRVSAVDRTGKSTTRVVLTWAHPELHPVLWSNVLGAPMPAPDTDPLLGITQVMLPAGREFKLELRLEKDDAEHARRLGVEAMLTFITNEGEDDEIISTLPISFASGAALRRFVVSAGKAVEEG